jgi:Fe-S cluster biogenesis protein NfuA
MTDRLDDRDFQGRLERLDGMLREASQLADPAVATRLRELVQAILELHGIGLARLLEHVHAAGDAGQAILDACAHDDIASGLLLLHGLHPFDVETRVLQALEAEAPALRAHGGSVKLLGVEGGVVRLRLEGNCHHCPSSSVTMQQSVEEAIYGKAPEVTAIEVEGLPEAALVPEADGARVALPVLSG